LTDKKATSVGVMPRSRRQRSLSVAPPAEAREGTERLFLVFFRKRRDAQRASEELIAHGYRVRFNEPDRQTPDWWLAVRGRTERDEPVIDETWRHWAREVGGEYGGSEARDDETHGQHKRYLDELRRKALDGDGGGAQASAWIYASFANGLGGGNPAGVVLSATPLADDEAQAIAAILSVTTTGFVTAPTAGERSVAVRFFTPAQEIDACGHVTIAIATALVEHGIWHWGDEVTVRARGVEFALSLRDGEVAMQQRLRILEPAAIAWAGVEAILGLLKRHASLPLAVAGTGLRHLIVPLADVVQLALLKLDASRIATLAAAAGVDTIGVWAELAPGRVRLRDLCASIGALEEPASGTTSGALALYLRAHGWLTADALVVEQGIEMGRPSRIDVTLATADTVIVRGRARKLLAGTLMPWSDDERS